MNSILHINGKIDCNFKESLQCTKGNPFILKTCTVMTPALYSILQLKR